MKNEVTFNIELQSLQNLIQQKNFNEADVLCTKMLDTYNNLDYELLLRRAKIRQCLMKYEEAILDANLALQILPQRKEAYHILSDFLVAQNNYSEALKILEILHLNNQDDLIIKGQYEQIKEKEKTKQNKSLVQKIKGGYDSNKSLVLISDEQFKQLKETIVKQQHAQKRKEQLMDEDVMVLSDELEDSQEEYHMNEKNKKNKEQIIQNLSKTKQLNFNLVSHQQLFDKKKEAYKMKAHKLKNIDCSFCKLVFDYTSICYHFAEFNPTELEELKEMMPDIKKHKDINAKKLALQKITKSLDILSTIKITSLTLIQGQFSDVISLYLKRDISALFGDNLDYVCMECCVVEKDPLNQPMLTLAQHALILVNRSLTFQEQALLLNEKEDLINIGGLEEEKANFQIDSKISGVMLEELKTELKQIQNKPSKEIDYQTLHFLTRAITNILILTSDQMPLFNQIRQAGIIKRFLEVLNNADSDIFKDKKNKAPQFCMFATHALRFFILCSSIDPKAVTYYEEPSLKQVLRKYELYRVAFPMNERLLTSLDNDFLWFKHSSQGCNVKNFYKEIPMKICANCGQSSSDLKICSRCMKVYYCNKDCQKAHYQKHKQECGQS